MRNTATPQGGVVTPLAESSCRREADDDEKQSRNQNSVADESRRVVARGLLAAALPARTCTRTMHLLFSEVSRLKRGTRSLGSTGAAAARSSLQLKMGC